MQTWKQGELSESSGKTGLAKRDQVILMRKARTASDQDTILFLPGFFTDTSGSFCLCGGNSWTMGFVFLFFFPLSGQHRVLDVFELLCMGHHECLACSLEISELFHQVKHILLTVSLSQGSWRYRRKQHWTKNLSQICFLQAELDWWLLVLLLVTPIPLHAMVLSSYN